MNKEDNLPIEEESGNKVLIIFIISMIISFLFGIGVKTFHVNLVEKVERVEKLNSLMQEIENIDVLKEKHNREMEDIKKELKKKASIT